uniref:Fibronectin type III domain containing 4 n=1 Tax=Anser cygnoides TaxID=8845 RepID=A0A8B9DZ16_ANSCY
MGYCTGAHGRFGGGAGVFGVRLGAAPAVAAVPLGGGCAGRSWTGGGPGGRPAPPRCGRGSAPLRPPVQGAGPVPGLLPGPGPQSRALLRRPRRHGPFLGVPEPRPRALQLRPLLGASQQATVPCQCDCDTAEGKLCHSLLGCSRRRCGHRLRHLTAGDITMEGLDKNRQLQTGEIIIIVAVLLMWAAVIALFCRQYDIIKDNDSNNNKEKTKPSSEHSTPERPTGGLLRSKKSPSVNIIEV